MRKPILGAALLGLLMPFGPVLAQSDFPGKWKKGFQPDIARALAKHQIRGCGNFRYKQNGSNSDLFLVECSKDGKSWTAYHVNVADRKVDGPLK